MNPYAKTTSQSLPYRADEPIGMEVTSSAIWIGQMRRDGAKVAESMLMNALAGDDKTIRNLFGFHDWYMKNLYVGDHPTQWKLLEALVERKPELFLDERIKQQAARIAVLENECARLKNYWDGYEVCDQTGDYVTLRRKDAA